MQHGTRTIASLILCLIVLASLCTSALAVSSNYVQSPSLIETTPILDEARSFAWNTLGENCAIKGYVEVTPYRDRFNSSEHLNKDQLALFEKAYEDIKSRDDVRSLCSELANLFPDKNLLVADLFDIHCTRTDSHHCDNYIVLDNICMATNFVALLHYTEDYQWEFVETTLKGNVLSFTVHSLSPFAIIVAEDYINPDSREGTGVDVPGRRIIAQKTGDAMPLYFYIGTITVATLTCGVLMAGRRRAK